MFTMMNSERLGVGVQGVAIAERAYQQARDYARTRVQGMPVGIPRGKGVDSPPPIIHHPDVRRMLLSMRAATEAMRALAYFAAAAIDASRRTDDGEAQFIAQRHFRLLIGGQSLCTDLGARSPSTGIRGWHAGHRGNWRRAIPARRPDRADLEGANGIRPTIWSAQAVALGRGGARGDRRDAVQPC
jgi:hypothetical protein